MNTDNVTEDFLNNLLTSYRNKMYSEIDAIKIDIAALRNDYERIRYDAVGDATGNELTQELHDKAEADGVWDKLSKIYDEIEALELKLKEVADDYNARYIDERYGKYLGKRITKKAYLEKFKTLKKIMLYDRLYEVIKVSTNKYKARCLDIDPEYADTIINGDFIGGKFYELNDGRLLRVYPYNKLLFVTIVNE